MNTKSPFYVVEEFISPLFCEDLVDQMNFMVPDKDKDGKNVLTVRSSDSVEQALYERVLYLLPELQAHYQFIHRGVERMKVEWFPEGSAGKLQAENSEFVRGKWLRTRARDFTGVLS